MAYHGGMATPQITLRVSREDKERWARVAKAEGTNVSEAIRFFMESWCDSVESVDSE